MAKPPYFFDNVMLLNASVLTGVNLIQLTQIFELILLIVSIIYTILKTVKRIDGDATSDSIVQRIIRGIDAFKSKKK